MTAGRSTSEADVVRELPKSGGGAEAPLKPYQTPVPMLRTFTRAESSSIWTLTLAVMAY